VDRPRPARRRLHPNMCQIHYPSHDIRLEIQRTLR
jgi:hypothetical protein